jgi:hypothetical protein
MMWLSVSYLALWSVVFPENAQAVVRKIKCEQLDNKYWSMSMLKNYARVISESKYKWGRGEFKALNKLWTTESHWNLSAYNNIIGDPTDGSHAGGIPQLLGMNPDTPAPLQIERGLEYIHYRYKIPSVAWFHHRVHGWY